jgi:hypothetical protein
MGGVNAMWMESQARGWDAPDKAVCPRCVEDEYLRQIIKDNAEEKACDYCKRRSRKAIAAPVEAIMEPIATALFAGYADPSAAGVPRDSGEWVGEEHITNTGDALDDVGLECDGDLFHDIAGAFHNDAWYPCADGYWADIPANQEMGFAWGSFVEQVKHRTRFFFGVLQKEDEEMMGGPERYFPTTILQDIGGMVHDMGLVKELKKGTRLYRARKSDVPLKEYKDLGPPPKEIVTAGRMNPAGIAYFYLARHADTAVAETLRHESGRYALATFKTSQPLAILDLSDLSELPSPFDADRRGEREHFLFLAKFVREISASIARDGREHIDYVPSQIVSEYFAQVATGPDGEKVRGIAWTSAVDGKGVNVVLFPEPSYYFTWDRMVELVDADHIDPAKKK